MKKTVAVLLILGGLVWAPAVHAQVAAAETQALAKQLALLMRNPHKPKQDVYLKLDGCHAQQLIRDRDADVRMAKPLAVSYDAGGSGWAVKMDNGVFEMKMDFDWADVTSLTYEPDTDDDGQQHYQITIKKTKKGNNVSFDLPLYTTSEATVKDMVRRLEKLRQSCGKAH
jgi:hypothetical protein